MWAEVTLVIPNYNGAAFILESLAAVVAAAGCYPGSASVVVVDDGSTDESVRLINDRYPEVKVIAKQVNGGFAQAVKTGFEAAQTDWVVMLNSDVVPDQDFLRPLMRWVGRAQLFAVGCRIERSDGTVEKVSWVRRQMRWGEMVTLPWRQDEYEHLLQTDSAAATLFASGGSMLVNRQKFLALGGFLPVFEPYYYEDVDLGIRAWRRGWHLLAEPGSRVVHDSGGTIDRVEKREKVDRIKKRNKCFVDWIHVDAATLWLQTLPRLGIKMMGWAMKGRSLEIQACRQAIAGRRGVWSARQGIQRVSELSLRRVCTNINEMPAQRHRE